MTDYERSLAEGFVQDMQNRQREEAHALIERQDHHNYQEETVQRECSSGLPLSYGQDRALREHWGQWAKMARQNWDAEHWTKATLPPGVHTPDEHKLAQLKAERDAHKAKLGPLAIELERQLRGGTAWSATVKALKFNADLGKLDTKIAYEEGLVAGCIQKGTVAVIPQKAVFMDDYGVHDVHVTLSPLAGLVQATIRVGQDVLFPVYQVMGFDRSTEPDHTAVVLVDGANWCP